jgi:hypothetical protein
MAPDSIYSVLHRDCFELFPDAMFADLFTDVESARGARLVPIRRQAQGAYPDSKDHKSVRSNTVVRPRTDNLPYGS